MPSAYPITAEPSQIVIFDRYSEYHSTTPLLFDLWIIDLCLKLYSIIRSMKSFYVVYFATQVDTTNSASPSSPRRITPIPIDLIPKSPYLNVFAAHKKLPNRA